MAEEERQMVAELPEALTWAEPGAKVLVEVLKWTMQVEEEEDVKEVQQKFDGVKQGVMRHAKAVEEVEECSTAKLAVILVEEEVGAPSGQLTRT